MKPLRIAHLADTHLGYRALNKTDPQNGRNQRSVDIEQAFARVIDDVLTREVDLVLHSGDLFHQTRPAYSAIGTAIRQFRKLESAGIPTYVIGGNHDTPRLRTSGAVFSILEIALQDSHFCGAYDEQRIAIPELDVTLTMVPHGRLTNHDLPFVFPPPGERHILVTHGFVPGMDTSIHRHEPGEEEIDAGLMDEGFSYIALGHYHRFGRTDAHRNAWYSGATERIGWGDLECETGYALVEIGDPGSEPVVSHIPLAGRPMHSYPVPLRICADEDSARIAADAVQWLEGLNSPDAMTRVVLPGVSRPVRRQAETLIRRAGEDLVWSIQVIGTTDLFSPAEDRGIAMPQVNLLDQFRGFVDRERELGNYDPVFAGAFLSKGLHELEQATLSLEAQIVAEDAG